MIAPRPRRRLLLGALLALTGCLRPSPAPVPADALPRRLVLALDGVDYRDVLEARAIGRFRDFRAPSRLVSTFPSISDIAWHDILGVQPPAGYQRIYFNRDVQAIVGRPLDAIAPIEFEERVDLAFGGKFHHLGAYLRSDHVAREEVDDAIAAFWRTRDRRTLYVYNVGPDALQHTKGDLEGYLAHLDDQLAALMTTYRARTGRALEIVVLSDHGHNRATDASFLPLVDSLTAHGFRVRGRLDEPADVALSVDGVTTGFGLFCDPDSIDAVAGVLASIPDVDVVSSLRADGRIQVRAGASSAWIESDRARTTRWRYLPERGDPLLLASHLVRLRANGQIDVDGFADDTVWARVALDAKYPAAVQRIVRGHTAITLNPAPILVSVSSGARVGFGFVSMANRLRPLGGTHGALDSTSALGVVMTTFRETHDDVTSGVRAQLDDFADLGDRRPNGPVARVTTGARLTADPRGDFHAVALPVDAVGAGVLVEGSTWGRMTGRWDCSSSAASGRSRTWPWRPDPPSRSPWEFGRPMVGLASSPSPDSASPPWSRTGCGRFASRSTRAVVATDHRWRSSFLRCPCAPIAPVRWWPPEGAHPEGRATLRRCEPTQARLCPVDRAHSHSHLSTLLPPRKRSSRPRRPAKPVEHLTSLPTTRDAYVDTRIWLLGQFGSVCAYCATKVPVATITLDHVSPRRGQTAYDRRDNLVLCCRPCNERKADQSILAFLLARRERAVNLLRFGEHLSPMLIDLIRQIAGPDAVALQERRKEPDYPYAD